MQVKKQQLEPDMEQQDCFQIGKRVQGCILSPCLFNLYAEYMMQNAELDESQTGIKIARRGCSGDPVVKNPPASAGTWVWSLLQDDSTCRRATNPWATTAELVL